MINRVPATSKNKTKSASTILLRDFITNANLRKKKNIISGKDFTSPQRKVGKLILQ